MSLREYQKKRDFRKSPEPRGRKKSRKQGDLLYVVQKHDASRLHYDFRLQIGDTLKSWAVPKGPSVDPGAKRLAVHVEDHPIEYGDFEGTIPKDEYGGGTVMLWDRGTWRPHGDAEKDYDKGKLSFDLEGARLGGAWTLVRMGGERSDDGRNWLLIKADDKAAGKKAKDDPLKQQPDSVASGRSMEDIAEADGSNKGSGDGKKKTPAKSKSARPTQARLTTQLQRDGAAAVDLDNITKLRGARRGSTPATFRPQLASPTREVPKDDRWLHEIKFDGYRILALRKSGKWKLLSRNGKDWTKRLPAIADGLEDVPLDEGILDGEVVVLKDNGVSDFQALQNALRRDQRARMYYYVFDVPYCNGYDLTDVEQIDRKRVVKGLLDGLDTEKSHIRLSEHMQGGGPELLRHACRFALEGLIAKRADATYVQKRSKSWLKIKCSNRQEFVIVGFTDPKGSRKKFGALLVGVYEGEKLVYSGKVGTGFDEDTLEEVHDELAKRELKNPKVEDVPAADAGGAHWVKPELLAEVEFSEWTSDNRLRHPVFHGLRADKPPEAVHREEPSVNVHGQSGTAGTKKKSSKSGHGRARRSSVNADVVIAGVTLSNPDKLLYPEQKFRKRDIAEYYEQIADWVLPMVVERPLSIVRCPSGHQRNCFYQKHANESMGPAVHIVKIKEKSGKGDYLYIKDLAGLISLVQLGVLEVHPWSSRVDRHERPDRMVFDLDPDPSVSFAGVMNAARLVRDHLAEYDLRSFVKTTGGKGLHVVLPLLRRNTWDDVRSFSEAVARAIVQADPDRYVANMRKEKRKNRVFIDYLRNARGATSIAAYSTRARAGATVATPLRWDELTEGLTPDAYHINNVPQRLSSLTDDPWKGFDDVRQSITKGMLSDAR